MKYFNFAIAFIFFGFNGFWLFFIRNEEVFDECDLCCQCNEFYDKPLFEYIF